MTNTTWLYDVINLDGHSVTVRVPFNLDTFERDWLRVEPWCEPESKLKEPRWKRRRFPMRCTECGDESDRKSVGPCRKCGRGWMRRYAG